MARMLVVLAAAFAAVAVWPTLGLLIALAAIGLFVVAWRRPMALTGVMAHPLVQRVPAAARAIFRAVRVDGGRVDNRARRGCIGHRDSWPGGWRRRRGRGGDGHTEAGDSASPRPTSSPRPTAEPTARPTAESTPLPTATPEPTPAFGSGPTGPTEVATVASVTDGDTIRVMLDGQNLPVRYIGIDTPRRRTASNGWGTRRRRRMPGSWPDRPSSSSATCRRPTGTGASSATYGSTRIRGGCCVPRSPRLGVAEVTTYPPDVKYVDALYLPAQREARESGIGLWGAPPATPAPVAPAAPGGNCELSYPDFCLPIGTSDLDCGDVQWRRFTVLWDVANPDPHRFDREGDGLGCELKPRSRARR